MDRLREILRNRFDRERRDVRILVEALRSRGGMGMLTVTCLIQWLWVKLLLTIFRDTWGIHVLHMQTEGLFSVSQIPWVIYYLGFVTLLCLPWVLACDVFGFGKKFPIHATLCSFIGPGIVFVECVNGFY